MHTFCQDAWRGFAGLEREGERGREREGGREGGRIHALTAYARTRTFARMRSHVREPYTCYTCAACTHSSGLTRIPSHHCHSALYCANAQVWAPRFVQLSKTKLNFCVEQGGAVREQVDLLDIDVLAEFEEGKHDSLSVSLGVNGQGSETAHLSNCMISENDLLLLRLRLRNASHHAHRLTLMQHRADQRGEQPDVSPSDSASEPCSDARKKDSFGSVGSPPTKSPVISMTVGISCTGSETECQFALLASRSGDLLPSSCERTYMDR